MCQAMARLLTEMTLLRRGCTVYWKCGSRQKDCCQQWHRIGIAVLNRRGAMIENASPTFPQIKGENYLTEVVICAR